MKKSPSKNMNRRQFAKTGLKGILASGMAPALLIPQRAIALDNLPREGNLQLIQSWKDPNYLEIVQPQGAAKRALDNFEFDPFDRHNKNRDGPYRPNEHQDWNTLETPDQRSTQRSDFSKIDKTSEEDYVRGLKECGYFEMKTKLRTDGFNKQNPGDPDIPEIFNLSEQEIGEFNIPVYGVIIDNPNGENHAINAIVVGDDAYNFNDWEFFEPQNDNIAYIGQETQRNFVSIPNDCSLLITDINKFLKNNPTSYFSNFLIRFDVENGVAKEEPGFVSSNLQRYRAKEPLAVENTQPEQFGIGNIYPNPFNANTAIPYSLSKDGRVVVDVFNASSGQKLETLVDLDMRAGKHSVKWNAENYPSGVYIARLRSGNYLDTEKMTLIK